MISSSPRRGALFTVFAAGLVFGPWQIGSLTGFVSSAHAQAASPAVAADAMGHTDAKGRHLAPHDTFYLLEYVSARTDKGVEGFEPGAEVHLVEVHRDTQMLVVSDGHAQVEVSPSKLTNDMDIAALVRAKDQANQTRIADFQRNEELAYERFQRDAAEYTARDLQQRQQAQKNADTRAQAQANATSSAQPTDTASVNSNGYYNEGGLGYGSPFGYFTNLTNVPATNGQTQATTTNPAKTSAGATATGGGKGALPSSSSAGGKRP